MQNIYAQRRHRFAKQMQPNSVAIIPTAKERPRNRDSDFPFRPDSYFYYLTGFSEPNACLVLHSDGESQLFCQAKNLEREIWDGFRLGPEAAPSALGVDQAYAIETLAEQMPKLLGNSYALYYPFATHTDFEREIEGYLRSVRALARQAVSCPSQLADACLILDEMRLFKDEQEIETMRRAAQISAAAHIRAMQLSSTRLRAGLDTREYHLEAELLHEFRMHGSEFPAYTSIVAAGANACVLHYRAADAQVFNGDLVLIDAGCELNMYASDITRTFPANGKFTAPQRDMYQLVLAAQETAIATTKPGSRFHEPHDAALRVLTQGMLDYQLLDANKVGTVDDAMASKAYMPFYMHRTGHWLGMDVHDCGSYFEPSNKVPNHTDEKTPRLSDRRLQAGMVLTVEPGIYVRPDSDAPAAFHNIGIRIEDDALVSTTGCELLSRDVPVSVEAIESLMQPS